MIDGLEQLDVLLKVLHLQLPFGLVEGRLVCLMPVKVADLVLLRLDVLLGYLHPSKQLGKVASIQLQPLQMTIGDFVKSLAVCGQVVGMVVNQFVASVHFVDEEVALFLVSPFQLG